MITEQLESLKTGDADIDAILDDAIRKIERLGQPAPSEAELFDPYQITA